MAAASRTGKAIGQPVKRVDGVAKVTGRARYAGDFDVPGMIFGRCLRSPHPSARIVSIDTRQAKALPGVHAVLTGADVPDIRYGRLCRDYPDPRQGRGAVRRREGGGGRRRFGRDCGGRARTHRG